MNSNSVINIYVKIIVITETLNFFVYRIKVFLNKEREREKKKNKVNINRFYPNITNLQIY